MFYTDVPNWGCKTDDKVWCRYLGAFLLLAAFRKLRDIFGINTSEYLLSICGDQALRELPSPGKSGRQVLVLKLRGQRLGAWSALQCTLGMAEWAGRSPSRWALVLLAADGTHA